MVTMQLKNSAAWLLKEKAPELTVKEAPLPEIGDDDLLIKAQYVAINPVDWKIQASGGFGLKYPAILGQDVAGEVIEVGKKLKGFKVGSRVIAHAQGFRFGYGYSAFQLYPAVRREVVSLIPDDMAYEDAVVLPLSISTASAGLYQEKTLGIGYPTLESGLLRPFGAEANALLLWGGSSSVGSSAIQLATASGYHVITTASPANYEYCKLLGATLVLDYHNPDIVPILVSVLKGINVVGAYDAIGSDTTVRQSAAVLHGLGGGKVVSVVSAPQDVYKDVTVVGISSGDIVTRSPQVAEKIWGEYIPNALKSGKFVPAPKPLLIGTGLDSVQDGLDQQRKGVSARKVVVKL